MDLRHAKREAIRLTIDSVHWGKRLYEIIIPYFFLMESQIQCPLETVRSHAKKRD